jgi:hypothetical protein
VRRVEPRASRVVEYVPARSLEVSLVAYDPRREAALEEVPAPAVSTVEALGVGGVQPVHGVREHRHRCLEDEVVVRVHETPRVTSAFRLSGRPLEDGEKLEPIDVIDE